MEELVLRIGGCHHSDAIPSKSELFGLEMCTPGWLPLAEQTKESFVIPAVDNGCIAHLCCSLRQCSESDGHYMLVCQIDQAFVRERYWDGKRFINRFDSDPPYLTFLGSQTFAYTVPATFEHE
jgi:hypothetical protein